MIEPEIILCEQGSPEWFEARRGIPTASRFSTILASGKSGGESKTRRTYINQLAGEIITGEPMKTFTNGDMERGKALEPQILRQYEFDAGVAVARVGFIKAYRCGGSPDGLIGADGMVEFKSTEPHLMIEILRQQPAHFPEHRAQCQGNLLLAQRHWIDLCIYSPKLPMYVHRQHLDRPYCNDLEGQIHIFNKELDAVVAQIRGMS